MVPLHYNSTQNTSVNWIIRLLLSILCWPKVILLCSAHCIELYVRIDDIFIFWSLTVYIALGLLISLQPPFYPSEAEAMGASPAEYGFVFGIANLSLFIFRKVFKLDQGLISSTCLCPVFSLGWGWEFINFLTQILNIFLNFKVLLYSSYWKKIGTLWFIQ